MKLTSILLAIFVGLIFFVLFPYLFILLNDYFSLPVFANDKAMVMGGILGLLGLGLVAYCSGLFLIVGKGTPAPIEPPKKLVFSVLYKYTRISIYIVFFMILLGEFMYFGRLFQLFYLFLIITAINPLITYHEEPVLKKRFGKSYKKYLKEIPRWF